MFPDDPVMDPGALLGSPSIDMVLSDESEGLHIASYASSPTPDSLFRLSPSSAAQPGGTVSYPGLSGRHFFCQAEGGLLLTVGLFAALWAARRRH